MNRIFLLSALFVSLCINLVWAQPLKTEKENLVLRAYGNACEELKKQELRSSARLRVTDKASFAAAESLSQVNFYRDKLNNHDFSVFVYQIIDNYLENVVVKTLVESKREICVEVKGDVSAKDVESAWHEAKEKIEHQAQKEAKEKQEQEKIKAKVLVKNVSPEDWPKTKIYIYPTRFYNKTESKAFAAILTDFFQEKEFIEIVTSPEQADYLIYSDVLKAKVDAINRQTNRLQMVVSLDLQSPDHQSLFQEHQNRFVIFSMTDNEQEVASNLLRKMFCAVAKIIYKRIEHKEEYGYSLNNSDSFITPTPLSGDSALD